MVRVFRIARLARPLRLTFPDALSLTLGKLVSSA
jgi:hypothetical protein